MYIWCIQPTTIPFMIYTELPKIGTYMVWLIVLLVSLYTIYIKYILFTIYVFVNASNNRIIISIIRYHNKSHVGRLQ